MRILITGARGRLGSQLVVQFQHDNHTVTGVDLDTLDTTDFVGVMRAFADIQPELVIHCAALTAVDYCAEHPDEALAANGWGVQPVALACQQHGAALVYISTNEVFESRTLRQFQEYDPPNPSNPYAYSKWVGEQIVRGLVPRHYIVRTAWLFAHGGHNFVQTILRLAREGRSLRVVLNEVSSPTYNNDLAAAVAQLVVTGRYGTYHLTNAGYVSRYAFARHLLDLAGYPAVPVEPITLAEYPRASHPPQYAVLRNFAAARLGITLRPWQEALAAFLETERVVNGQAGHG